MAAIQAYHQFHGVQLVGCSMGEWHCWGMGIMGVVGVIVVMGLMESYGGGTTVSRRHDASMYIPFLVLSYLYLAVVKAVNYC